jgi:hypothetical protein
MNNNTIPRIDSECQSTRGQLFNNTASTTFQDRGIYGLWIERNLGYQGNAGYGFDTVTLGNDGEGGVTIGNATVGRHGTADFWLGIFGLNPKATNFTNYTDLAPSHMTNLFQSKKIPSVSFGYTAGARYRKSYRAYHSCVTSIRA